MDNAEHEPLQLDEPQQQQDEVNPVDDSNLSPEQHIEQVLKQLIEAVGDLSVIARTLERWPVYAPPIGVSKEREDIERAKFDKAEVKGKQRVAEHLRRFMRKSRRISEIVSPGFDHTNLPQDLINHIDSHLSPNLWLRGLVTEVQYANDITRGELTALGSLHSTLMFYMRVINDLSQGIGHGDGLEATDGSRTIVGVAGVGGGDKTANCVAEVVVPDFSLPSLAPTVLRPPVIYDDRKIEVTMPHVLRLLNKPITPYDIEQDPKDRVQARPIQEVAPDIDMDAGSEDRVDDATPFISGDGNGNADDSME